MGAEQELTGMAKHFNSVTMTGRANVAKVSASFCGTGTYIFTKQQYQGTLLQGFGSVLDP